MQVRALGGGTVFNSAICMRALDSCLERWVDEAGLSDFTPEALAPHYDAVEALYGVKPTDEAVFGRRNELFRNACDALNWAWEPIRRFESGCKGSGQCILGCPNGAKNSIDRRGIPEFLEMGGRVYTSAHVERIVHESGQARGVRGRFVDPTTHERSHEFELLGDCTIVCAGAIGTPLLLRRSGLRHPAIGRNVMYHPSCYVIGRFEDEVNPWFGATQGVHATEHLERGIKLESLWATASTFSRSFPRSPKRFKRALKQWSNMAVWDAWVSGDSSSGMVRELPGGKLDLTYDYGLPDFRRLQESTALLCEMFDAVGAKEVITGIHGLAERMPPAEAAERVRFGSFEKTDLPTASNHVMGGASMAETHGTSAPCDSWGRVREGGDRLFVCDTSLFPSSAGVNPQLTAMALAHRLSQELPARFSASST